MWISRRQSLQCKTCGRYYTVAKTGRNSGYCSRECVARQPCELCGTPVTGRNSMNGRLRRFCSRRCAILANRTLTQKGYRLLGFAYTIIRLGRLACEDCGEDDIWVLQVHHKAGKEGGNSEENLITLCANCHERRHREGAKKRIVDVQNAKTLAPIIANRKALKRPKSDAAQGAFILEMPSLIAPRQRNRPRPLVG